MKPIVIWGHRGASARAPENTLAAFRTAESAGADGIELDVQLSRDGVPVVLHDETLDRTTDGFGAVARQPLAALRRLDAGSWFAPRFAGERLPTLAEVLDWAQHRLRLNLELKSPAAARAVLRECARQPRCRVLVSSFDHRLLARLRRQAPDLPLGFLVESRFWRRAIGRAEAAGAVSVHPRQDRVSRQLVAACHRRGLKVYVWTVDDPGQAKSLLRLGVDGLFCNDPGRLRGDLGEWEEAASGF